MFEKRKDNDASDRHVSRSAPAGQSSALGAPGSGAAAANAASANAAKAYISGTIAVKGELSGNEDVVIAGHFEGNINLPSQSLTITQGGKVRADVHANIIEIQGELIGDVEGMDKVLITPTGRMQGNIKSPRVILDDGAQFKGSIDMEPTATPKPAPQPAASRAAQGSGAPAATPKPAGAGQGGQSGQGGQGGREQRQGASS